MPVLDSKQEIENICLLVGLYDEIVFHGMHMKTI